MLDLWQQLSSTPGVITKKTAKEATGAAGPASGAKKQLDPVDDIVNMEHELAGDLCSLVDAALAALKKVPLLAAHVVTTQCHMSCPFSLHLTPVISPPMDPSCLSSNKLCWRECFLSDLIICLFFRFYSGPAC